jgi:hypothetical protein
MVLFKRNSGSFCVLLTSIILYNIFFVKVLFILNTLLPKIYIKSLSVIFLYKLTLNDKGNKITNISITWYIIIHNITFKELIKSQYRPTKLAPLVKSQYRLTKSVPLIKSQ